MHPQLQLVADEYRSAQARLHDLVRAVPDEQWSKRSDRARWSVAECVAHLNITSLAYVPLLQHAVSRARMLERRDRKSTRLNSSHGYISYAVFCLKKKKNTHSKVLNRDRCNNDLYQHGKLTHTMMI